MTVTINWHPLGTSGPWRRSDTEDYAEILASDAERAVALVGNASDADAIAEVPAMVMALQEQLEFCETERRWAETSDLEKWIARCDALSAILARIDGGAA